MVTISNQMANIIRPSVDCSMWRYITQYIPGKQVLTVEKFIYLLWFVKADTSLHEKGITNENAMYDYVVQSLAICGALENKGGPEKSTDH